MSTVSTLTEPQLAALQAANDALRQVKCASFEAVFSQAYISFTRRAVLRNGNPEGTLDPNYLSTLIDQLVSLGLLLRGYVNGVDTVGTAYPGWSCAPLGVTLLTDLLGYYRFDGNADDSSGNSRNLSAVGTYASPGVIGQYLTSGAPAVTSLSIPVTSAGGVSLSAWVRFTGGAVAQDVTCHIESATGTIIRVLARRATAAVRVTGLPAVSVTASGLAADAWHHVVASCSGSTLTLYVDGALVGTTSCTLPDTVAQFSCQAGTLVKWDEFAAWGRSLTAAEVLQLYNGGSGYDPTA